MGTIPQNHLFRLRFPVGKAPDALFADALGDNLPAEALDESYRLPFWSQYDLPDGFDKRTGESGLLQACRPEIANRFDFRLAWNPGGLALTVVVAKKKRQGYSSHHNLHSADCVRLCVDTRDVKENRRANGYCHKFLFYPFVGETQTGATPLAQWLPINRAKAMPNPVEVKLFRMSSEATKDGYRFSVILPATTMTGFDANEFDRFGMHYVVRDQEYGAFVLQYAEPAPCEEDPSLWASFVMKD